MYRVKSQNLIRCFIATMFLIISILNIDGQSSLEIKNTRNSIHLDCATFVLIGMYSINYERTITDYDHIKFIASAGFGGWYLTPTGLKWYYGNSIPLGLNTLIGSGNNYFEMNWGMRYTIFSKRSDKDKYDFFPIFNLGYRHQRPDGKGLMFRSFVGLSGIGIGVGKAF